MNTFNMFIVPIHMLQSWWPVIKEGVGIALKKGGINLHTPEMVIEHLIKQEWTLIVFMRGSEYIGFQIITHSGKAPDTWLEVIFMYLTPESQKHNVDYFTESAKFLETLANTLECKAILCFSNRKAMGARLKPLGYNLMVKGYGKRLSDKG